MKHWTQESTKDFAYHLSLDFFTQLQDRFEQAELLKKEFAKRMNLSAGRISQIFNSPPENPQIESLVRYAQALGLKVSVVAYDDGDPTNEKGPVFSGIFSRCWESQGKPREFAAQEQNLVLRYEARKIDVAMSDIAEKTSTLLRVKKSA